MLIIGCDYHPGFQQLAIFDTATGEVSYRRLPRAEVEEFYRGLSEPALVGMEACGFTLWFEELLAELGHRLWIGDAARIRAAVVRRQKTDQRDADHILTLLLESVFPDCGCRRRKSAMCGSCCCIVMLWCDCGRR